MYWLLVGLVRSLKSSHKEALKKPLLYEDYSDLTSPTSNQIPEIDIAISTLLYITYLILFSCMAIIYGISFILTVR